MGQTSFVLLTNQEITNSAISGNGRTTIYTSSTQLNPGGFQSLRLIVEYVNPIPLDGGSIPITYTLNTIVESLNGIHWYPIAYQFESFSNPDNGLKRIIVLQPNMNTFDAGIDDVVYVGGAAEARISRQQGKVGSSFRVRIICNETGFGGAGAFQSATISICGELYDIL